MVAMGVPPESTFSVSPDVLSQRVRGETVLLDLNTDQYFGLNEVGSRIWELVGEGQSLEQLIDTLLAEYDVTRQQLEADVRHWLGMLLEAGLLEIENSEGRPAP